MRFLSNEISKYCLHDTAVNEVIITAEGFLLILKKGIYHMVDGKQTKLSEKCIIKIAIDSFDSGKLYEHISINKISKKRIEEEDCTLFFDNINSSSKGFEIDMDYYSEFAKSILLKGFLEKKSVELIFTEIEKIEYIFEN